MTNYYKVYITNTNNGKTSKLQIKKVEDVRSIIYSLKDSRYRVIKRIKLNTDIPVASGYWYKGRHVVLLDNLDIDYRIIDGNVVNYDIYKKNQEDEGR